MLKPLGEEGMILFPRRAGGFCFQVWPLCSSDPSSMDAVMTRGSYKVTCSWECPNPGAAVPKPDRRDGTSDLTGLSIATCSCGGGPVWEVVWHVICSLDRRRKSREIRLTTDDGSLLPDRQADHIRGP